jgi:hypothetical protein
MAVVFKGKDRAIPVVNGFGWWILRTGKSMAKQGKSVESA